MPRSDVSSESSGSDDSALAAAERAREAQLEEAAESDTDPTVDEPITEEAVESARRFVEKERKARAKTLPELPYTTLRQPGVAPIGAGSDFLGSVARAFGIRSSDLPRARRGQPSTDLRCAAGELGLTAFERRVLSESGNLGARLVRAWDRAFGARAEQHGASWVKALTQPLTLVLSGHDASKHTIEWLGKLQERIGRYLGLTQPKFAEALPSVEPGLRLLEEFACGEHGALVRSVAAHHCDEATSAAMVTAVAAARAFLELADWRAQGGGVEAVKGAAAVAKEAAASKAVSRILRPPPPFPVGLAKKQRTGDAPTRTKEREGKEKRSEAQRAPAARPAQTERRPDARPAPKKQR